MTAPEIAGYVMDAIGDATPEKIQLFRRFCALKCKGVDTTTALKASTEAGGLWYGEQ